MIFPSRIRIHNTELIKSLSIFNPKIVIKLSERWYEMLIPNPDFFPSWVPYPRTKKHRIQDHGSGSATLLVGVLI
jgi:hypothetical protein